MTKKRGLEGSGDTPLRKRQRHDQQLTRTNRSTSDGSWHPVLQRFYPEVCTLRTFIWACSHSLSKRRERLLRRREPPLSLTDLDANLQWRQTYQLLDRTLVGYDPTALSRLDARNRSNDFQNFTQQLSASTAGSLLTQTTLPYAEIIDFVLWLLFFRTYPTVQKPSHILCQGYSRASSTFQNGIPMPFTSCAIPGLVSTYPNEYIERLRGKEWECLHSMLGKHGDRIMVDMFVHCGLYVPIEGSKGTMYQLSGQPLSDMVALSPRKLEAQPIGVSNDKESVKNRKLSEIRFVRHRMLYARAAFNAKGETSLGLRHIHVFRRFPDAKNRDHTVHVMKYLFPNQFGLHNVFTSKTDRKDTAQGFKDYTLREEEIARVDRAQPNMRTSVNRPHCVQRLPKRLRAGCFDLVVQLQKLQKRCSYTKLLHYYCPLASAGSLHNRHAAGVPGTESEPPLTSLASSLSQVSAFCGATILRVFPFELFGSADISQSNIKVLLKNIEAFIRAKRYETLTLEMVMRGMKIVDIEWLQLPRANERGPMSMSDFSKRKELFAELLYYIFDSFLIPLIRSNFHVTESSTDKNQLFYFRHDIWKTITEPAVSKLKMTMLEEMGNACALQVLNKRELGFSQIRLLPKGSTLRPISNLKQRARVVKDGRSWLGKSINSILAPVFSVLKYEKQQRPDRLGASLFSVSEMFPRLRAFRSNLRDQGLEQSPLYFVKVDVKACFDSLPQVKLNTLAQTIFSHSKYTISSHAEIKPSDHERRTLAQMRSLKPSRRFCRTGNAGLPPPFVEAVQLRARIGAQNTIFVDTVVPQTMSREQLSQLQSQHIGAHIVRIGKKYYRQKLGIPQGSVLSSLLCNFFFADFESEHLAFLSGNQCVLFRLIDDFLLISARRDHAERFLRIMHAGNPTYGIRVKAEKSLVNFQAAMDVPSVSMLKDGVPFPYCGVFIDTKTLDIRKGEPLMKNAKGALTVEYSNLPGQSFRRKILSGLKIQMHTMLFDTSHNSLSTVFSNLSNVFNDVALKCFEYARCLPKRRDPLTHAFVQDIAALAFAMMKRNRNKLRHAQYRCQVGKSTVQWLAANAFLDTFGRKPAKYADLIKSLRRDTMNLKAESLSERQLLLDTAVKGRRC